MKSKTCSTCSLKKKLSDFNTNGPGRGLRAQCKACQNKHKRKTLHALASRYSKYKGRAKGKKWKFHLSLKKFEEITSKRCIYCGGYSRSVKKYEKEFNFCGIDRVNSSCGYTYKNTVPCCSICNKMKMTLSKDNFLEHVKKINKHRRK